MATRLRFMPPSPDDDASHAPNIRRIPRCLYCPRYGCINNVRRYMMHMNGSVHRLPTPQIQYSSISVVRGPSMRV
eukprot:54369-Eustigmatos_ZCMA.PRE.1